MPLSRFSHPKSNQCHIEGGEGELGRSRLRSGERSTLTQVSTLVPSTSIKTVFSLLIQRLLHILRCNITFLLIKLILKNIGRYYNNFGSNLK